MIPLDCAPRFFTENSFNDKVRLSGKQGFLKNKSFPVWKRSKNAISNSALGLTGRIRRGGRGKKSIETQLCLRELKGPVVRKEVFGSIPLVPTKGKAAGNNTEPQQLETTGGRNRVAYTIDYIHVNSCWYQCLPH